MVMVSERTKAARDLLELVDQLHAGISQARSNQRASRAPHRWTKAPPETCQRCGEGPITQKPKGTAEAVLLRSLPMGRITKSAKCNSDLSSHGWDPRGIVHSLGFPSSKGNSNGN